MKVESTNFITPSLNIAAVFNSAYNNKNATRPPYLYLEFIIKNIIEEQSKNITFSKKRLISFEVIALEPYTGFSRLFESD